ncbi:MAG TPA: DegV family protein [Candidatus Angelobacter sp.]|jgi:DegV family protein with EDD domain|nr:DegV family protein [Candidatus Angelobacter sp.]
MLHLVTDSTSDLLAEGARRRNLTVVPLTVRFGDEQLRDGVDIDSATFYRRLVGSPALPTTSQPSPEQFAEVYRALLQAPGDEVVSVHLPAHLSGTVQSATLAAREVDPERVHVVDSWTISGGLQLLLDLAVRERDQGLDAATVVKNLEGRRDRVTCYVLLDTITYLQKGGRIGRAQAFIGGVLNVKPIVSVERGEVGPAARVRSKQQGVAKMVELVRGNGPLEAISMMHGDAAAAAGEVRDRLTQLLPELEIPLGQLGPVVGTYAGPGSVGVAVLRPG